MGYFQEPGATQRTRQEHRARLSSSSRLREHKSKLDTPKVHAQALQLTPSQAAETLPPSPTRGLVIEAVYPL